MSLKSKRRQDALLSILPKKPQMVTAAELRKDLKSAGYNVSLRTVQRDLKQLESLALGVHCDRRELLFGWYKR